jgi:hypothetical protein
MRRTKRRVPVDHFCFVFRSPAISAQRPAIFTGVLGTSSVPPGTWQVSTRKDSYHERLLPLYFQIILSLGSELLTALLNKATN